MCYDLSDCTDQKSAANSLPCPGVDVLTETVIARPLDVVANYAADPNNAPTWYVNIKSVEWKSDPPLRVGSRFAFVAHFLGRKLAYTYTVIDYVAGRRLVMSTTEGPFPMETTYTWEAHGDGVTTMTLRNRGDPGAFFRLLTPFMTAAMRRANRKDLARLRGILEAAL
jgi:hypothetical protein